MNDPRPLSFWFTSDEVIELEKSDRVHVLSVRPGRGADFDAGRFFVTYWFEPEETGYKICKEHGIRYKNETGDYCPRCFERSESWGRFYRGGGS